MLSSYDEFIRAVTVSKEDLHISVTKLPLPFPLRNHNHTILGLRCTTPAQLHLQLLAKVIKGSGNNERARKSSKTGGEALKRTRIFGNQMITT